MRPLLSKIQPKRSGDPIDVVKARKTIEKVLKKQKRKQREQAQEQPVLEGH